MDPSFQRLPLPVPHQIHKHHRRPHVFARSQSAFGHVERERRHHSPQTRAAALQSELRTEQSSSDDFSQQTSEFGRFQQGRQRKRNDYSASEQRGEGRIDQSRIGAHADVEAGEAEYKRSISKRVCFLEQRVWQEIGLFAAVRAAVIPIAQRQIPYSR